MKLKNLLNTIADELFSVDHGGDRPVTVNDLRLIVTALIKEIKEDEERANDRLRQSNIERLKRSQEFYEPTSIFNPDSV